MNAGESKSGVEQGRGAVGLLAIESSQREISVAIRTRSGDISERVASGDPKESDLLLPAIVALCTSAGLSQRDLRGVAVSTGPGGFTGLRVAVASAKGICEALSIPAISVPSAAVAAMGLRSQWWPRDKEVIVALASKGEECWVSTVAADDVGDLTVRDAKSVNAESFDLGAAKLVIADEHLPRRMRQRALDRGATIATPTFRASDCLIVGEGMFRSGAVIDAGALRVIYPREPEAVTLWRARYPTGFSPKGTGKPPEPA